MAATQRDGAAPSSTVDFEPAQPGTSPEKATLLLGRDGAGLKALAARLRGHCQIAEYLDEQALRGQRPVFRAAVLRADNAGNEHLARLGQLGRSIVANGAVVVVSPKPVAPATLFGLMLEEVDVCEMDLGAEPPAHLRPLVEGLWPGVRHLRGFCRAHRFSGAQTRVFLGACAGLSKVEAHELMGCSVRTLESHWSNIFTKVRIRCVDGVMAAALRHVVLHGMYSGTDCA